KLPVASMAPSPYNLMSLVVEISDASVSTEPAPRAYKVMSCKPEKEISGPKAIEPFCVARRRTRIPEKVSGPPGEPDVIPSTAIRPRFISPFAVEIVGLPANSSAVNLNAAPEPMTWLSNPLAVSKAEVDPKPQAE